MPGLVLKLSCEDVLRDEKVIDEIDQAISGRVDVVVLSDDGASGGKLYEAACLLKSLIKGRAYLLIDGRVDIAAAVSASGVLLSDQGCVLQHFTHRFELCTSPHTVNLCYNVLSLLLHKYVENEKLPYHTFDDGLKFIAIIADPISLGLRSR